jgi:hypothetical protein
MQTLMSLCELTEVSCISALAPSSKRAIPIRLELGDMRQQAVAEGKNVPYETPNCRWLAACLALGTLLTFQLNNDPLQLTSSADAATAALDHRVDGSVRSLGEYPEPTPILAPSPDAMTAIRERPVFRPDRSSIMLAQQTTVLATDAGGEKSLPNVELAGTLLSERNKVALVVNGEREISRMRVGETVADWKIMRIERDRFLLKRHDQVEPLMLREHQ